MHLALIMLLWSDWVGTYSGKLDWRGCTAPGHATATVTLDAADAVMSIDLGPAGGALPALTLVYDDEHTTWSGQQGDLCVTLSHPRDNALAVAVELDSGCTMHATLARTSSGIAACDRMLGWARIAGRCTRHEPPADLAALAKRTWKKADAASCTTRATQLATDLVAAGCAPDPDAATSSLGAACRALADETRRLARCPRATPAMLGIAEQLDTLPATHPDPAQRAIAEANCQAARDLLAKLAQDARCPI